MKKPSPKDLIEFMESQAEIGIEVMKMVTMNKQDIIEIKKQLEVQQSQLKMLAENTGLIDPVPKLKVLDQSVFDGQDEKWRFAAVDGDGCAYAFTLKPEIDEDDSCFIDSDISKYKWIGKGYDATNWKNSLIERETELTGSDLCRAMLSELKKPVMCRVSKNYIGGGSYGFDLIKSFRNDGERFVFQGKKDSEWIVVTPINTQDEPLTASEAGL